ncbi:hypothetical protein BHE74_00034233 [Ensete ventricosum]|nr:hypothetical protein BHE74_00034233 [Ensete ventricosum]
MIDLQTSSLIVSLKLINLKSLILSLLQGNELFLRTMISGMENVYLSRNPTSKAILELVRKDDGEHICYDHFAFRTFGVNSTLPYISFLILQEVIRKYIKTSDSGYEHAALASTMGCLTWEKPSYSDYQLLSRYFDKLNFLFHSRAQEFHRRDGFEVGNADKIFESTSRDQVTRKAA